MRDYTAKDIMNRELLTVWEGASIEELSSFLIENEVSGAPVVGEKGNLVGVVSLTDIVRSEIDHGGIEREEPKSDYFVRGWEESINRSELHQLRLQEDFQHVRDIMTPTVFSVPEDTPVSEIAKTMISGRIHRLLVTCGDRMVGIVTTLDLLKLLVK